MFCPKCGKADQVEETYCRQCGVFLPDLTKAVKREASPEENLKVNTVLTLMTVIVCFSLALLLYIFLGFRPETPILIYLTAGLLIAMGGWHIQTFIRTRQLRRQWKRGHRPIETGEGKPATQVTGSDAKQLEQADMHDAVPASVTESTTRHLDAKLPSLRND